ncbi:MAG: Ig-like domain-containing protein, partial [Saprospiraceae bacterium]
LSVRFASATFTVDSLRSADMAVNTAYTGATGTSLSTALLLGTDSMTVGEQDTLRLYITVSPGSNLGPYNNQAKANATGQLGTSVEDYSNDGSDVDPENDGPDDNNTPSPITFTEAPELGVAKTILSGPTNNNDGTYTLTYRILVKNTGDVPLSNIQVRDSLNTVFGQASSFVVLSKSATSPLLVNTGFNGTSDNGLLASGSSLNAGQQGTIDLQIKVTPGQYLGPYNNTAYGRATSPVGTVVTDVSQDGTDVDPDSDGNPGNNSQVTPVTFVANPQVGIAKRVLSGPTLNTSNGSFRITYRIRVENTGDVPLSNFQVEDDLALTFLEANSFSVYSIASALSSGGLTVNNAYDGSTNRFLYANGQSLPYQGKDSITLVVDVYTGNSSKPYYNSAIAFGTSPSGTIVMDASQDGVQPNPDMDDTPRNNNVQTPVNLPRIVIGAAKQVLSGPTSVGDGTYTTTYQVRVKNMGGMDIYDMQLFDTLSSFGTYTASTPTQGGKYTISTAPSIAFISSGSALTTNSAFTGSGTQTSLLNFNAGDKLEIGDSLAVNFTVKFRPFKDTTYRNQVIATGDRFQDGDADRDAIDPSHEGTLIDPDGDGIPNQVRDTINEIFVGNNDTTKFSITLQSDLSLTKTVQALGNGKVKFTLTLRNNGPADAYNTMVEDSLSSGLAYDSHSAGKTFTYNSTTRVGVWNVGTIVPGADSTLEITCTLSTSPSLTTNHFRNFAQVSDSDQPDPDSSPDNDDPNEDDYAVAVPTVADLRLTKTSTVLANGNVKFTLRLYNDGPATAKTITVTDTLSSSGYTYVSHSLGRYNPSTHLWSLDSLQSGRDSTLEIVVSLKNTVPFDASAYINKAQVDSTDAADPDSDPRNNDPTEDDQASSTPKIADLALSKTLKLLNNGNYRYRLVVFNEGPDTATNVSVLDTLPNGVMYVSDNGSGSYNSITGIWTIGTIPKDSSKLLEIEVTAIAPTPGVTLNYKNIAQVYASDQADPTSSPNNDDGDQSEDDEDSVLPSLDAHPDFNATFVNVPVSGTVTTNDNVPSGSTYGTSPTPSPSNPPGGQLTMNADGSYTFKSPYVGVYVYDVPVCPPGLSVPNCNPEKLTIHVIGYNQPNEPVANPDIATTLLDQNVTLRTLSNDRAGDIGGILDPASVLVLYHNSAAGNPTVDPATGDITFDPASTFVGVTSYIYRVCDFSTPTPLCDTTFQEVTVIEPSDPNSTQAADDYAYTYSGVPVSGSVKTNDNDPQGHTQTVTAQDSTKTGIGRLVLGTNGGFTFTPVPGFHGPTSYTYQTCDNGSPVACHDATLYILVYPLDPTPDINATLVKWFYRKNPLHLPSVRFQC